MNRFALKNRVRRVKHALLSGVVRSSLAAFSLLPERVLLGPVSGLGAILLRKALGGRAKEQLALAFPEMGPREIEAAARGVCRNFGRLPAELILARRQGFAFLEKRVVTDESLEYMEEARAAGKGVIVVSAHIGNWELFAWWGAHHYPEPLAVVGKRIRNPGINRLVNSFRTLGGALVIDRDDPPRRMLRHLARPGLLGVLPDQDVDVLAGEFLEFFGRRAYTSTGPAALSLASGAPMIPGFLLREGDRFRVRFMPPIFPSRENPRKEEIVRLTRAWSGAVEDTVREYTDQWAWFHKRWASTPETVARKRRRYLESRKRKALAGQGGGG